MLEKIKLCEGEEKSVRSWTLVLSSMSRDCYQIHVYIFSDKPVFGHVTESRSGTLLLIEPEPLGILFERNKIANFHLLLQRIFERTFPLSHQLVLCLLREKRKSRRRVVTLTHNMCRKKQNGKGKKKTRRLHQRSALYCFESSDPLGQQNTMHLTCLEVHRVSPTARLLPSM